MPEGSCMIRFSGFLACSEVNLIGALLRKTQRMKELQVCQRGSTRVLSPIKSLEVRLCEGEFPMDA